MRKFVLALALCLFASPVFAQAQISTTTCPGAGCQDYPIAGNGSVGLQITGTWVGTITFEGSVDNINFSAILLYPINSSIGQTTTTINGIFNGPVAGIQTLRVVFTAYTSGAAVVSVHTTLSAKSYNGVGTGGGSSGGTVTPPTSNPASPNYLLSGGQVVWTSAYTFDVSAATYVIQGTTFTSAEQSVTLAAADPTNPRIDVIALNSSNTVVDVTGTAAAQPSTPVVDPGTQLALSIVTVAANSTQPSAVASTLLYADNVGSPTEWNCTTSGTGFNCNSTSNPRNGTKDIEGTNVTASSYAQLQIGSGSFDPTTASLLVFYIRSKATWQSRRGLQVAFYSAGVLKGTAITINSTGSYGFNSASITGYQQVAIPISQFQIPAGTTVTQLRFIDFGGSIGFYIDDVTVQGGAVTVLPQYALTDLTNVLTTATPRFSQLGLNTNPDSLYQLKVSGSYYSAMFANGNSGTSMTINWANGNDQTVVLTGNVTFTFSNPVSGGRYVLLLSTGSGSFTVTWPAAVKWPGGTAPTITTTASKQDLVTFIYDGTSYIGSFNQNY